MSISGKLPWFPFYPADFITDPKVMAMSLEEVGVYFCLLFIAWNEEPPGTLPDCDETIARFIRESLDTWLKMKPRVTAAFKLVDGRWHQKRMMAEALKIQEITCARRRAGSI